MCIPLFWQFDFSNATLDTYDAFSMAPLGFFHIVIFYGLVFVFQYFNRKSSLFLLLLLALYFPFIQLANYPSLTIRDTFLHAAPTEWILETGSFVNVNNANANSFPGSYILYSIFSSVTGCDLITANIILYFVLLVCFVSVLYCFAKVFEKNGYVLSWLSPMLFLAFFFNILFDNFHHYSRTTFAFVIS